MLKKILVVEDEVATLKMLGHFLSMKNLDVHTAQDGLEALELMKEMTPDAILLDVIMPRLDGYGFLREIKKIQKFRTIPVVILTAREMMRDTFIQEGVLDFVVKPYDPEELYKTLLKYL